MYKVMIAVLVATSLSVSAFAQTSNEESKIDSTESKERVLTRDEVIDLILKDLKKCGFPSVYVDAECINAVEAKYKGVIS